MFEDDFSGDNSLSSLASDRKFSPLDMFLPYSASTIKRLHGVHSTSSSHLRTLSNSCITTLLVVLTVYMTTLLVSTSCPAASTLRRQPQRPINTTESCFPRSIASFFTIYSSCVADRAEKTLVCSFVKRFEACRRCKAITMHTEDDQDDWTVL